MDAVSVLALVLAAAVALWQWRVMRELHAIREEIERWRADDA